jgi:hypothetical protein
MGEWARASSAGVLAAARSEAYDQRRGVDLNGVCRGVRVVHQRLFSSVRARARTPAEIDRVTAATDVFEAQCPAARCRAAAPRLTSYGSRCTQLDLIDGLGNAHERDDLRRLRRRAANLAAQSRRPPRQRRDREAILRCKLLGSLSASSPRIHALTPLCFDVWIGCSQVRETRAFEPRPKPHLVTQRLRSSALTVGLRAAGFIASEPAMARQGWGVVRGDRGAGHAGRRAVASGGALC